MKLQSFCTARETIKLLEENLGGNLDISLGNELLDLTPKQRNKILKNQTRPNQT